MKHIYTIVIITTMLAGCTTTDQTTRQTAANFINRQSITKTTHDTYPSKNPQQIALYMPDEPPHMAYRVIGEAKISKYNIIGVKRKDETLHEMMKSLAASIGGDGVINIEQNETTIKANIIAFQKILI